MCLESNVLYLWTKAKLSFQWLPSKFFYFILPIPQNTRFQLFQSGFFFPSKEIPLSTLFNFKKKNPNMNRAFLSILFPVVLPFLQLEINFIYYFIFWYNRGFFSPTQRREANAEQLWMRRVPSEIISSWTNLNPGQNDGNIDQLK